MQEGQFTLSIDGAKIQRIFELARKKNKNNPLMLRIKGL